MSLKKNSCKLFNLILIFNSPAALQFSRRVFRIKIDIIYPQREWIWIAHHKHICDDNLIAGSAYSAAILKSIPYWRVFPINFVCWPRTYTIFTATSCLVCLIFLCLGAQRANKTLDLQINNRWWFNHIFFIVSVKGPLKKKLVVGGGCDVSEEQKPWRAYRIFVRLQEHFGGGAVIAQYYRWIKLQPNYVIILY